MAQITELTAQVQALRKSLSAESAKSARLEAKLAEALEQQAATSEVLKVISGSLTDLQPVFETIGERAANLCNADFSLVARVDGDLIHLATLHGGARAGVEAVRQLFPMRRSDETITARAVRAREVVHIPDRLADPHASPQAKDVSQAAGIRGCLAVPLLREELAIGVIFVARTQPGYFPDAQIGLLKTFADQAVIA